MNANIIVQDQSPLVRFWLIDAIHKQMTDGYDETGMRYNNLGLTNRF
jgi:hypothetical protein